MDYFKSINHIADKKNPKNMKRSKHGLFAKQIIFESKEANIYLY